MNRRSFLSALATAASAMALDPERLLWVPGKKTIFIPLPPSPFFPKYYNGDLEIVLAQLRNNLLFVREYNRDFIDAHFKLGATIQIRRPQYWHIKEPPK